VAQSERLESQLCAEEEVQKAQEEKLQAGKRRRAEERPSAVPPAPGSSHDQN